MDALINPRKEWFRSLAEARTALKQRNNTSDGIYRQKQGRHKGQYFVGWYYDFINRY